MSLWGLMKHHLDSLSILPLIPSVLTHLPNKSLPLSLSHLHLIITSAQVFETLAPFHGPFLLSWFLYLLWGFGDKSHKTRDLVVFVVLVLGHLTQYNLSGFIGFWGFPTTSFCSSFNTILFGRKLLNVHTFK